MKYKNIKLIIISPLFFFPLITTQSVEIHKAPIQIIPVENISGTEAEFNIRVLSKLNNFDEDVAVRIAKCESQMGKYKTNWSGSSATGLYQFMPKTFNAYCLGDIKNDTDQINCFIKLYNKYPHWWECK